MFCDECFNADYEQPSPKRKESKPNFVQRTLDMNMSLSTPLVAESPSNKTAKKPTTQKLFESLQLEMQKNTVRISALKSSVDSMHDTITQQKEKVGESIGMSNDNITSLKTSLSETCNLIKSIKKQSYSNIVKGSSNKLKRNETKQETPKSSRSTRDSVPTKKPAVANGTSNNVIGKPLTPPQYRPKIHQKMRDKAIWISRLHRDTSVEEIKTYVRDMFGIVTVDRLEVRKLVKKDRDISTYSFVSFSIRCPANLFEILMDATKWPERCDIREFKMDTNNTSTVVKLNVNSPSKSEPVLHENQTPKLPLETEDMAD